MPPQAKKIEFDGLCLSLRGWSRRTGISACTISDRLKRGWTVERALTTPVKRPSNVPERIYAQSDKCRGCTYGRLLHVQGSAPYYCAYLGITGHCRPWAAVDCPGYGKRK